MRIVQAEKEDLRPILELQYLAYQSEATLCGNTRIPPLTQTLSEVEYEFEAGVFLKAVGDANAIVGSVRGRSEDGSLHIGKLIVRPDLQGRGIGTALLAEMEKICPHKRYELFTSSRSVRNIALYERLGYVPFAKKEIAAHLIFVYLEKKSI